MADELHACVLLADVVGSRDVDDREAFGRTLRDALATVTDRYGDDVVADLAVLKGVDEFGGVLAGPAPLVGVVTSLQAALHPVVSRYAVVAGEIDVNPGAEDVRVMDGPAFHRADELLADLGDARFALATPATSDVPDDAISAGLDMVLSHRENWTERQAEVVETYRRHDTQRETADALGVSPQSVSRVLSQADHDRIARAERLLTEALGGT